VQLLAKLAEAAILAEEAGNKAVKKALLFLAKVVNF